MNDNVIERCLGQASKVGKAVEHVARVYFGVTSQDQATVDRSKSMLLAAETRHATKAVWKIGDEHVTDMKKALNGKQPKFALQHASEFTKTYRSLDRVPRFSG
jgi:hypothetical protein